MAGFEPGSTGVGIDHSANCATTAAQASILIPSTYKTDRVIKSM